MGLFTKNKLELKLERYSFKSGEVIKGSFIVDLKKTYHVNKRAKSLYKNLGGNNNGKKLWTKLSGKFWTNAR